MLAQIFRLDLLFSLLTFDLLTFRDTPLSNNLFVLCFSRFFLLYVYLDLRWLFELFILLNLIHFRIKLNFARIIF